MGLSVREHMVIRLASTPYRYEGHRESDVLEQLDMRFVRFWQVVDALLDRPEAWAAYPMEVKRLRAVRDRRRAHRCRTVRSDR